MRRRSFHRKAWPILFLAVLALSGSGCEKPTAQVSGVVKYKGKTLTSGTIVFLEKATNRVTPPVEIDIDGTYYIPVAPTGPATVLIETLPPVKPEGFSKDSPEMKKYEIRAATYIALPSPYMSLNSSITCDLQAGPNTFDIDLKE